MPRRSRSILEHLVEMPWWASVVAAAIVFAGMRWGIPLVFGSIGTVGDMFAKVTYIAAPYLSCFFLAPAPFAAFRQWREGELLTRTRDATALSGLTWQQFESLVAAAYRRLGYQVEVRAGGGADGGVDLVLREPGKTTFVQCKHWNRRQVGVATVRELYGVMNGELAEAGIVVTGGRFTADAETFAHGKSIELVNGGKLEQLLSYARGETALQPPETATAMAAPSCPNCASQMVLRKAQRGASAGAQFWGCPRYPSCKGTRGVRDDAAVL